MATDDGETGHFVRLKSQRVGRSAIYMAACRDLSWGVRAHYLGAITEAGDLGIWLGVIGRNLRLAFEQPASTSGHD